MALCINELSTSAPLIITQWHSTMLAKDFAFKKLGKEIFLSMLSSS